MDNFNKTFNFYKYPEKKIYKVDSLLFNVEIYEAETEDIYHPKTDNYDSLKKLKLNRKTDMIPHTKSIDLKEEQLKKLLALPKGSLRLFLYIEKTQLKNDTVLIDLGTTKHKETRIRNLLGINNEVSFRSAINGLIDINVIKKTDTFRIFQVNPNIMYKGNRLKLIYDNNGELKKDVKEIK